MKCTPQKTIVDASVLAAMPRQRERVADVIGDVLDLGRLVVVGEDDRVARAGQASHLVAGQVVAVLWATGHCLFPSLGMVFAC